MALRILLLGDITGHIDEGMKNTTFNFKKKLEMEHEVMVVHPRQSIRYKILKQIRSFNPQIIHYIHGPTFKSFVITKFLSLLNSQALSFMSVPKPTVGFAEKMALNLINPNVFLLQSKRNEDLFINSGAAIEFIFPGVNVSRFQVVTETQKKNLRKQFELPYDKFIVLHVGHISQQRNVKMFMNIQKQYADFIQVVIVGALTMNPDMQIVETLKHSGCMVWLQNFGNIEEIYQLADCYVFPGMHNTSAIEIPLSVLEAMACNLPVITDRFGGLPDLLQEGEGLFFVSDEEDIHKTLLQIYQKQIKSETRAKVKDLSWENVVQKLESIYSKYLCRT